jgi:hypothetical protein
MTIAWKCNHDIEQDSDAIKRYNLEIAKIIIFIVNEGIYHEKFLLIHLSNQKDHNKIEMMKLL